MYTTAKKVFFVQDNLWVHQKCDGLTNLQYKALGNNSEEPWYCRICKTNMLPFYNLTTNQFLNFIESNNNIPPTFNHTFKDINTCSICNKKNKNKNKKNSLKCSTCKSTIYKKYTQKQKQKKKWPKVLNL